MRAEGGAREAAPGTVAANDRGPRMQRDRRATGTKQAIHGACGRHKNNDPAVGAGV